MDQQQATATEIVITKGSTPLRNPFTSTSSTRMFILDDRAGTCRDPKTDQRLAKFINEGNFKSISHGNGGFSYQYGVEPNSIYQYIGSPGQGWDAIPPINPTQLQGDLAKVYTLDAKYFDFLGAHNQLRKMMNGGEGAESFIIANIYKGSVQDVLMQIDLCNQRLIHIQFGEEGDTSWWTPQEYAVKTLDWIEQIKIARPDQKFRWGWDIPTIYKAGKKVQQWIDGVWEIYGPVADKENFFIRQYLHLFQQVDLTGDINADIQIIDDFINNGLPLYAEAIDNSVFAGHRVFIGQVSANEFSGTAYSSPVTENMFYLVACYFRFTKFMIESLRDGKTRFIGQCFIGMNQWISQKLIANLDFEFVSRQNRLFGPKTMAAYVTHPYQKVHMVAATNGSSIRVCILNVSGVDLIIPQSLTYEGIVIPFVPVLSDCVYCNLQESSTCYKYDPIHDGVIKGLSMNYFEFMVP